jgi:acetyl-CoA carboxylase carboxyltransferase component
MCGPQANNNNAFTLGTPLTEIYVMNGETAAAASYARRLLKEEAAGNDLNPALDKMNQMIKDYQNKSRPAYCAMSGFLMRLWPCETCVNMSRPLSALTIKTLDQLLRSIKCSCLELSSDSIGEKKFEGHALGGMVKVVS